ncbi:MAG: hypothetical protein ACRCYO_02420, partial [Bacteroidia bacterium]
METTENKTRQDYLNQTLSQTKTIVKKFFNHVDTIDRKLYGRRMKLFLWGSLIVLIGSPFIDFLFNIQNDKTTYYTTLLFFIFILLVIVAFIGSW